MTLDDFRRLNFREAGSWPLLPKIVILGFMLLLILAAGAWFDWKDKYDDLERVQGEELKLREQYTQKKVKAINFDLYVQQLKEVEQSFGALVKQLPNRAETSYTAQEQDASIRAFRDEVVAAIGAQNLVDVRSPDEYAGRLLAPAHLPQEQAQRAGHIPTAANVPWSKAANDDGTFKSDDELKQIYTEAGVDWDKDTIAYCRIGERSSHTWFVLRELLGQQNVKNYDGSWTEYGSLVGVPVVLGDEAGEA